MHRAGLEENRATNPFTKFASRCKPIDEANVFPLLHKSWTDRLKPGVVKTHLARPTTQASVIALAHGRFMHRQHELATNFAVQARLDMRDHFIYQLGVNAFRLEAKDEDGLQPKTGFGRFIYSFLAQFFPHLTRLNEAYEDRVFQLRVEREVTDYLSARSAIAEAMLIEVSEHSCISGMVH